MPRLSAILVPVSLAFFVLSAHAARQDGLVVYLTFDDENNPLKNFAPVVPGREPIEPVKIGEALEPKLTEGRFGKAALFNTPALPKVAGKEVPNDALTRDWAISLGKMDDIYAGSFSVFAWVKVTQANRGMIMGNKESFNPASGWALSSAPDKTYLLNPLGGGQQSALRTNFFGAGWRKLVIVVDRAALSATAYVGVKNVTKLKIPYSDAKLGEDLPTVIGAAAKGAFGTQCAVDEVAIWNRALSESEVVALGTGKRVPEPASYAWAALGATAAAAAIMRRRRVNKSV